MALTALVMTLILVAIELSTSNVVNCSKAKVSAEVDLGVNAAI